jgi:hypothetical protein
MPSTNRATPAAPASPASVMFGAGRGLAGDFPFGAINIFKTADMVVNEE